MRRTRHRLIAWIVLALASSGLASGPAGLAAVGAAGTPGQEAGQPEGRETQAPAAATAPPQPPAARPPSQPSHPAAAKAYVVLETFCARCHQSGHSSQSGQIGKRAAPWLASGLANILDLDAIARVPSLVRPGIPDASPLYHRMFVHASVTPSPDAAAPAEPGAPEIEAVRDWIEDLGGSKRAAGCSGRAHLSPRELAAAMQRWLKQVGAAAARDTRFLSVAHLQNDCATDGELAAWRQAATKVMASLSWSEKRPQVEVLGDALSLYAVRLSDLGWLAAHWEKLVAAYPRGTSEPLPEALTAATGTAVPVLPADWLASVATRAPLYYELLGLPPTLGELRRLLGVDQGSRGGAARADPPGASRLALRASAVTRTPRVIERQSAKGRPFWIAAEHAPRNEARDVLDQLAGLAAPQPGTGQATGGPAAAQRGQPAGKDLPPPEGARVVFALPNGMPAFGAYAGDGRRVDRAVHPVAAEGADRGGVVAGLGCLGCHVAGVVAATDEMRAHIDGEKFGGDAALREAARRVYPGAVAMQKLLDEDGQAFRRAAAEAGIDPELTMHGLGIVTALARQYDLDVGIGRAAAEFGLERAAFVERLQSYDGPEAMQMLALRLRQGTLSRREAERLYAALRSGQSAAEPIAARTVAAPATTTAAAEPEAGSRHAPLALGLWTDTPSYRSGELLAVHAAPSADCHLTVISVDAGGKATVLFPNDFEQDNLVRGGRVHRVPARNGAYQLRLKERGVETLIAACDTRAKAPEGIEHDFERQRFTVLGDWRSFLRSSQDDTAGARREPDRAARARGRRPARGRNGEPRTETRSDARGEAELRPEASARTAIQITVE